MLSAVRRLLLADTGSHAAAASGDSRAKTKGGVGPAFTRDVFVAKSMPAHAGPRQGRETSLFKKGHRFLASATVQDVR
jgi:hypothetical protein